MMHATINDDDRTTNQQLPAILAGIVFLFCMETILLETYLTDNGIQRPGIEGSCFSFSFLHGIWMPCMDLKCHKAGRIASVCH